MAEEVSRPYRLRQGAKHFGAKPGDTVHLTAAQSRAFGDKFEPVDGPEQPMVWPDRFGHVNEGIRQDFGGITATRHMVDENGKQVPAEEVVDTASGVSLGAPQAKIALQPAILVPEGVPSVAKPVPEEDPKPNQPAKSVVEKTGPGNEPTKGEPAKGK